MEIKTTKQIILNDMNQYHTKWVKIDDVVKEIEEYMSCYEEDQELIDVCLALIKQLRQSNSYGNKLSQSKDNTLLKTDNIIVKKV